MGEGTKRSVSNLVRVASLRSWLLAVAAVVVIGGITFSLVSSNSHLTPQQRITQIESEVKCPSCDGISALDSNTAGAFAVRSFVKKQVKAGASNKQIIDSLEASYGPTILMSPPAAYGGRIIAALPFVFIAIVLGLMGVFGYRRLRRGEALATADGESGGLHIDPAGAGDDPSASEGASIFGENSKVGNETGAEASIERVGRSRRLLSLRQSWLFYLGALLLLGGAGSGVWLIRSQSNASKQLAAASIQVQNEAETILQARVLANKGQDVQALKLLSAVLEVDPTQPVALTYQGWLLRQAGEKDKSTALINQGEQFLKQAVKLDPGYPDARVFLGYVLLQDRHDLKGAITQFNAFLADKPSASFISATKSVLVSAYRQAGLPIPPELS
jgi:cytochrome c-type biogenesis protein CcmH